jgi:hypothetical protein
MSRQQAAFKADDYNQPTEPMEYVYLPPSMSTTPGVPGVAPQTVTTPVSQQPYQQPLATYPVLPQAPFRRYHGTPAGGATRDSRPARRMRRSPIPGLVRFVLFLVQFVLVVRIVCVLFGVQNTTAWLTLLVAASDLFVLPVRWLAANINLSLLAGTELLVILELLVALLAYGMFSRLLVRILKVVFNS